MLQNAYFLAKIGADTAENEQHFAEILPKTGNYGVGEPRQRHLVVEAQTSDQAQAGTTGRVGGKPEREGELHVVPFANEWRFRFKKRLFSNVFAKILSKIPTQRPAHTHT